MYALFLVCIHLDPSPHLSLSLPQHISTTLCLFIFIYFLINRDLLVSAAHMFMRARSPTEVCTTSQWSITKEKGLSLPVKIYTYSYRSSFMGQNLLIPECQLAVSCVALVQINSSAMSSQAQQLCQDQKTMGNSPAHLLPFAFSASFSTDVS